MTLYFSKVFLLPYIISYKIETHCITCIILYCVLLFYILHHIMIFLYFII